MIKDKYWLAWFGSSGFRVKLLLLFLLGGLITLTIYWIYRQSLFLNGLYISAYVTDIIDRIGSSILRIFYPSFYLPVIIIIGLQLIYPAKKNQSILSVELIQDFIWYILRIVFQISLVWIVINFISDLSEKHLSFLTIRTIHNFPPAIRIIIFIFLDDFLAWFHHLVRHKIPIFWQFHALHHSQKKMNIFTDHRVHFIDELIALLIKVIPMTIFAVPKVIFVYYAYFLRVYTMSYHANLKLNYGWLKYILVTPQSHRVHHSIEDEHHDKNFGVFFSIWDWLFRTNYQNYDIYPETGITDSDFPLEKSWKNFGLIKSTWAQLIYPFRQAFR